MVKITDPNEEFPEGPVDLFPLIEDYRDFSGRVVRFRIKSHEYPLGWTVSANEIKDDDDIGYCFESHSPNSPFEALGNVRGKIRRGLSTRYLDDQMYLTHDSLKGYITCNNEVTGHGIVVDGKYLDIDSIERILRSYEGFEISIEIKDSKE